MIPPCAVVWSRFRGLCSALLFGDGLMGAVDLLEVDMVDPSLKRSIRTIE